MVETNLKKEVWSYFKEMQPMFLATCDGDQPKVRPVTLIHFNDKFWVSTGTDNAKVKQIKANNKIEFCLLLGTGAKGGYIRGAGLANIVQNKEVKKLLAGQMPFFRTFWKDVDDPNYTLIEIVIKDIEYLKPGAFEVEKVSL